MGFLYKQKGSYSYLPSYIYKTGSKYKQLTDTYQPLFEKYLIDKKSLSPEERQLMFIGIKHITEYIYYGFFYSVKEDYDSKNNQEKIISAIYYRFSKIYGSEVMFKDIIEKDIFDLAESSIFYSLGVETYKDRKSFLWNRENSYYDNFIKHITKIVFQNLSYDFMKRYSEYANMSNRNSLEDNTDNISVLSGKDIIQQSKMGKLIPKEIYEKIIDFLDEGETKYEVEIQKYLEMIYSGLTKGKS